MTGAEAHAPWITHAERGRFAKVVTIHYAPKVPRPRFRLSSRLLATAQLAGLALVLTRTEPVLANGPFFSAALACDSVPGGVLCVVQLEPSPAAHITWADALVVETPRFVRAARGYASYKGGSVDPVKRMPLALTAQSSGEGTILVRARAVVCADNGTACPTYTKTLRSKLRFTKSASR